jgi:hypothetical protein
MIKRIITRIVFFCVPPRSLHRLRKKPGTLMPTHRAAFPRGLRLCLETGRLSPMQTPHPGRVCWHSWLKIPDQHSTSFWPAERTARTWTSRSRSKPSPEKRTRVGLGLACDGLKQLLRRLVQPLGGQLPGLQSRAGPPHPASKCRHQTQRGVAHAVCENGRRPYPVLL